MTREEKNWYTHIYNMGDEEMKLSEFLKENDAYDKFVKNLDKEVHKDSDNMSVTLTNAFCWRESPEGYLYWSELNDKWQEFNGHIDDIGSTDNVQRLIREREEEMDNVTLHGYAKDMAEKEDNIRKQFDENVAKAAEAKIELKKLENQSIDDVLEERGSRYGGFIDNSKVSQNIKAQFGDRDSYEYSTIEALDMIANKIARIVNGDRDYEDNWVDIIGYAQLELNAIRRRRN